MRPLRRAIHLKVCVPEPFDCLLCPPTLVVGSLVSLTKCVCMCVCVCVCVKGSGPLPGGWGGWGRALKTSKGLYGSMDFVGTGGAGGVVFGKWQGVNFCLHHKGLYSKGLKF